MRKSRNVRSMLLYLAGIGLLTALVFSTTQAYARYGGHHGGGYGGYYGGYYGGRHGGYYGGRHGGYYGGRRGGYYGGRHGGYYRGRHGGLFGGRHGSRYGYGYYPYRYRGYRGGGHRYSYGGGANGNPSTTPPATGRGGSGPPPGGGAYGGNSTTPPATGSGGNGASASSGPGTIDGGGWARLAEGRYALALSIFAAQATGRPDAGRPKVGYALSAAAGGDLRRGAWAMRRALRIDPMSMDYMTLDEPVRARVKPLVAQYNADAGRTVGKAEAGFMVASLHYLLGDVSAACLAIDQAAGDGDGNNASTRNLQGLIAAAFTREAKRPPGADGTASAGGCPAHNTEPGQES